MLPIRRPKLSRAVRSLTRGRRGTSSLLIVVTVLGSACASVEWVQPVVYKGTGFDEGRYQADLGDCRKMVAEQVSKLSDAEIVALVTAGGAVAGAGIGAAVGAIEAGRATTTTGWVRLPNGQVVPYTQYQRPAANPRSGAEYGAAAGAAVGLIAGMAYVSQQKMALYKAAVPQCLRVRGYCMLDDATCTPPVSSQVPTGGSPIQSHGGGTYRLVLPPVEFGDGRNAHVRDVCGDVCGEWTQFGAYDSVAACDAERAEMARKSTLPPTSGFVQAVQATVGTTNPDAIQGVQTAMLNSIRLGQCIASDDPRLAPRR